jgi:2-polyprenyl-6-hydroxyphenyl methylase/3-demethylubiquinone-9 3-methyltransferase
MAPDKKTNKALQPLYEKIYDSGKEGFFIFDSNTLIEPILNLIKLSDKDVVDVGCGEGDISFEIATAAKSVRAYDYSQKAIELAREKYSNMSTNLEFVVGSAEEITGNFDVVMCLGTFEHLDNPWHTLQYFYDLVKKRRGEIVIACPSFINPRGYVWMALQHLFDVPMSLTDLHSFLPTDFERFAKKLEMDLRWVTTDYNIGLGPDLIRDFKRRLPNALRDAGLPTNNVGVFLEWLESAISYERKQPYSGSMAIYCFSFKS